MHYIHKIIRRGILQNLALIGQHFSKDVKEWVDSQWSEEFERLRFHRMAMSFFRYGNLHRPDRPRYDHIGYVIKHCKAYLETGELENLIDAANMLMLEFMRPNCHPSPHFTPSDGRSYQHDDHE